MNSFILILLEHTVIHCIPTRDELQGQKKVFQSIHILKPRVMGDCDFTPEDLDSKKFPILSAVSLALFGEKMILQIDR